MRKSRAIPVFFFCAGLAAPGLTADDDAARLVELMAKVGFATAPTFSPDGRTLAFVSNMSGVPQIWTVPTAGGYPSWSARSRIPWAGSAGRRTGNGSRSRSRPGAG
jgi:Tol biopolymer transport system component